MLSFQKDRVFELASELLSIHSPIGYTEKAMNWIEQLVAPWNFPFRRSRKGTGILELRNGAGDAPKLGISAHIDTLGLMVRSIRPDGTLAFTALGGVMLPTYDGEYCTIVTRSGHIYTGTILSDSPAAHVYPDARTLERVDNHMHVRIDELTKCRSETEGLGIEAGDFICVDPKIRITPSGFLKSRFLDDKLSVVAVLALVEAYARSGERPAVSTQFFFSCYEEMGHGLSWIPPEISQLISVDMGCIGADLSGSEHTVSICAKDLSGPYDYEMTTRLSVLAKERNIPYCIDIFPQYSSDTSAALRGGNDVRGALIGPGVHASHGTERSHWDAVDATMRLLEAWLSDPA
jgi:putative aminopeptidase FrvX